MGAGAAAANTGDRPMFSWISGAAIGAGAFWGGAVHAFCTIGLGASSSSTPPSGAGSLRNFMPWVGACLSTTLVMRSLGFVNSGWAVQKWWTSDINCFFWGCFATHARSATIMAVWARSSAVSRLGGGTDPTNLMDSEELVLSLWTSGAPALAPVVLADKGAPAAQALAFGGSGGAGWRPGGAAQAFAGGAGAGSAGLGRRPQAFGIGGGTAFFCTGAGASGASVTPRRHRPPSSLTGGATFANGLTSEASPRRVVT
mmetsp:Transcript_9685/g.28328  ORF Transcript_9685/g.28328 Transcript_9685/m.28328 type:complete len:257 (-) Transcript_9685:611-1381(-)